MTARKNTPGRDDPDNPEITAEEIARAIPARDFFSREEFTALKARGRGQRGPQKTPTKERVTLRISRSTLAAFRATGPGWQTRIDEALGKVAPGAAPKDKARA